MGNVISRTAAADDILRDAKTAHEQGHARGGKTAEIVEHRIAPTLALVASVQSEREPLQQELVTRRATRDAAAARSIALVGECLDVVWNRVGRPRNDARLDLIFPGGVGAYVDGPIEGLPDRMGVLIDLLGRGLHPKITTDVATEWVNKLVTSRSEAAAANAAMVTPLARVTVLDRSYYSLVRTLQAGLVATKRDLKSEGFGEAQIHEIIPDRPRASAKDAADETAAHPPASPQPVNGASTGNPAVTNG